MDDAFNYLAILFSVILGLAFTELLGGFRRLLLSRQAVRLYAPPMIWAATLLLVLAQTWWAMFSLRSHAEWSFAMYGVILLQTVVLYMICAIALPGENDMRAAYFAHFRPFFILILAAVALSIARDVVIDGRLPAAANLGFQLAFGSLAVTAIFTRKSWFHTLLASAVAVLYVAYVTALFNRLPGT